MDNVDYDFFIAELKKDLPNIGENEVLKRLDCFQLNERRKLKKLNKELEITNKELENLKGQVLKQANKLTNKEYEMYLVGKELLKTEKIRSLGLNLEDCIKLAYRMDKKNIFL